MKWFEKVARNKKKSSNKWWTDLELEPIKGPTNKCFKTEGDVHGVIIKSKGIILIAD